MTQSRESSGLEKVLAARLADRQARSQLRRLTSFPSSTADFSSNSYLSLQLVPELRQAYISLLERHASSSPTGPLFGSGGSRLLDGNTPFAESLEAQIAAFHHAPASLLFNSGFDANVGLFSCVPQPGDIIVYDELIHASVHDGMRTSRAAQRIPFRHNTVVSRGCDKDQGPGSLERVITDLIQGDRGEAIKRGRNAVFVAVEGVYSMDGDIAPLEQINNCVTRLLPAGNGHIIVDEAHSTGLFGDHGRGLVCEYGLEDSVFARVHTFGKAMGASGAAVLCTPVVREYLINYARTLIYTTAMPLPGLASIKVTYDFLACGKADVLRANLRNIVMRAHELLLAICTRHKTAPELLHIDPDVPRSPIIALLTGQPRSLATYCQQRGLIVRPIVAPTVPKGRERVRVCLHAANSLAQVTALAQAVEDWVQHHKTAETIHTKTRL